MGGPRTKSQTHASSTRGPHQFWLILFGLWIVFLSGALTPFFGTPGIIQAVRLKELLDSKRAQVEREESALIRLQENASLLEKSHVVQQREIRRVLGYAAPGEIIFDFGSDPTASSDSSTDL